jgi:hypothetical protein
MAKNITAKPSSFASLVAALVCLSCATTVNAAPEDHFITTWKTDNPGSSGN